MSRATDGRRQGHGRPADVLTGIDVLQRDNFRQLEGKRVALITNQTGRSRDGKRTVDLLAGAKNVKVTKLFSPEHGLFGLLDEKVGDTKDPTTGLHVYSLYGKTRRPTTQMVQDVDVMVFDIQHVDARYYTYTATMGLCMEEAAKHKIKFMVLDRPNPTTGLIVDGPIADKEHLGFTAYGPTPVAHGMTMGELAQLYNKEYGINCDLQVVQLENWQRAMWFDETGLMWINPSPNMRNLTQAALYLSVCFLEATNVSVGRGTDQPFEYFGAPWIDGKKLAAELNAADLPGLRFVPMEFTPNASKFKGERCEGVYVIVTDRRTYEPARSGVTMAWVLHKLFGDKFQLDKVENLLQNKQAMQAIRDAKDSKEIQNVWQADLNRFKAVRQKYLTYR
ncbi:MAG TPA: DUF1343 domain-containing protein [Tepidisphaeraceae bacterium]|jgi:uncharacterized protein YbbC (DUF1343 family)